MDKDIQKFIDFVMESQRICFFGGAGVSTESGVPDFRSKDGLYNQHDVQFDMYEPEYLLSNDCLVRNPKVFYEYYRQKMDARHVSPNITHKMLAKLEEMGKLSGVVTQNIDGLHQKAGSRVVYELHGTTLKNYCMTCGFKYSEDYIYDSNEHIPTCIKCGGRVRPDVTLYQEGLPEDAVSGAVNCIANADMIIIGGTSLKVYPAASFIRYFQGKHLAVINKEPLDIQLDPVNDVSIVGSLGDVFKALYEAIEAN
ncbi:MAG: NAD-dependent protein deacylase [Pseudobutyrivibrio sp.]|nr:NAD-dependent protein deacylase [Pseudobutyrivibrio sp.]